MKFFLAVFSFYLLFSCSDHAKNEKQSLSTDPTIIHDTIYIEKDNNTNWQKDFGLSHNPEKDSIWHKPASYYLTDKNCSGIARDFYFGYFRPSDNGATEELLKLAYTDNKKLRPFYRWCLNKTLVISDGALSELTGVPARKYAETFPDEFFEYLDSESDNKKYEMWVNAILYSGFFDYENYDNNLANRKTFIKIMTNNLNVKSDKSIARIRKFALDCTPEEDPLK